uniref:Uncharacterized protein n=1 Tax=Anopheles stephensi TaxID=30069 RepID=A0A182YAX0_ANOST
MSKFLTLRRPTTISKLLQQVPQHPDALPREVVPQWVDLLPSAKLPNRCCPVHAAEFSRGPLAQFRWKYPNDHGFDLQDACIRIASKEYHVLHDKHLRHYWTEALKKNLKHRGLISEDERVLCTLMELNRFRNFLSHHHRLHLLKLVHQMESEEANANQCKKIQTELKNAVDFCEKLAIIRGRADRIFAQKMEQQYLESFLTQMHHKVQDRKDMYDRKHKKLEQELVRRKTRNLASKYYRRSKATLVKALLRECKKSVCAKPGKTASMVHERMERAIDAAYAIHTTISPTTSSTQIIDTASQFILDLRDAPIDPLPQDTLITGYVVERLRDMMDQIVRKSVQEARTLIEQVAVKKFESLNRDDNSVRSSLSNQGSVARVASYQTRSEHPNQSRVSMGPAAIVEQYETERFSLKKCKYRPPTPVTSVTSLVEHTFHQSNEERISISALEVNTEAALDVLRRIHSDSYPLIHVMYSQRRYLEGNLLKYRMILQPYVDQRVLTAIDLDRMTMVSCVEVADSGPAEREEILRLTANALLKFPDSNHEYAVALFDSVNFLSRQAIRKVQQMLNAP